jgi:hypothetical protein
MTTALLVSIAHHCEPLSRYRAQSQLSASVHKGARSGLGSTWESPGATSETRKKITRTIISEIIVDVVDDSLAFIIHWQGGDHTRLTVKRNRAGQTRWTTDAEVVDLVRALARQMPVETVASVLNRSGKSTGYGNSWTRDVFAPCAVSITLPSTAKESAERGEVTLNEAAAALGSARRPSAGLSRMVSFQPTNIAKVHPGSFGRPVDIR